jgi:hypothetical protein
MDADVMPSDGGPCVGTLTGRASRALCKLSLIPSITSGISDKNCAIGPSTPALFDIVIIELRYRIILFNIE